MVVVSEVSDPCQGFMQGPMQGQGTMPPQGGGPQAWCSASSRFCFHTNSALERHVALVVDLVAHREMEDKGRWSNRTCNSAAACGVHPNLGDFKAEARFKNHSCKPVLSMCGIDLNKWCAGSISVINWLLDTFMRSSFCSYSPSSFFAFASSCFRLCNCGDGDGRYG